MAEEEEEQGEETEEFSEETKCAEGAPEWMVTFGDLMSLLLTFFILLLSFSSMDVARFKEMSGTIKEGFGVQLPREESSILQKAEDMIRKEKSQVEYNARRILKELKRRLDPRTRPRRSGQINVEIFETYRGVVLLFPANEVFRPGTLNLRAEIKPLLHFVAEEARQIIATRGDQRRPFELLLEVRADPKAPMHPNFREVWSLSSAQAATLGLFFENEAQLDPRNLLPLGRGDAPSDVRPGGSSLKGASVEFLFLSGELTPE